MRVDDSHLANRGDDLDRRWQYRVEKLLEEEVELLEQIRDLLKARIPEPTFPLVVGATMSFLG
jgi:hypothetical protein